MASAARHVSLVRWPPTRVLGLVAVCLATSACAPSDPGTSASRSAAVAPGSPRGVLLVVIDTLRADHVGACGSTLGLTPRLDALAAEGLVFTHTVASSSWTRPSVASILTGQYPTTLGVLGKQDVLAEHVTTLPERLGAAGYTSLAVSTNGNAGKAFGFGQGFDTFEWRLPKRGYPDGFLVTPAEEVTREGLALVDGLGPDERFFLFLHYIDPHDPYLPHPRLMRTPEPPGRFDGSRAELSALDRLGPARTPDDEARVEWLYSGEVRYCDEQLGVLFDGMRARGLLDDMLVVVTADHGEGLYDHGFRGHGTDLYEEQVRVPLVLRAPRAAAPAPARLPVPVGHVDIAPTILAACGLPLPGSCQGRDLLGALRSGTLGATGVTYSEMDFTGIDLEAVSDGRSKLIRDRSYDGEKAQPFEHVVRPGESLAKLSRSLYGLLNHVAEIRALNPESVPRGFASDAELVPGVTLHMPARRLPDDGALEEFFRLDEDPGEHDDRALREAASLGPIRARMADFASRNAAARAGGEQVDLDTLDPETIEELRALGYVSHDG
ncbi:MAG: sulfatase-like hydrolase/transferase [Planctomycetes bacterium]|nr:sulfatase-like hydrolase/transferase [Planctomycetota bacterium]